MRELCNQSHEIIPVIYKQKSFINKVVLQSRTVVHIKCMLHSSENMHVYTLHMYKTNTTFQEKNPPSIISMETSYIYTCMYQSLCLGSV